MVSYRQPCLQCGTFIDSDARICPACSSGNPFEYLCPACLRPVAKADIVCAGCGRELHINCPHCGDTTFVQGACEKCGESLMVTCQNPRCGRPQFFQNRKCTACGKILKPMGK